MMLKFKKRIDKSMGGIIVLILSLFKIFTKRKVVLDPRKILVIKLWAVGESILVLPLIDQLKKNFKDSKIDVLCTENNKDVFTLNENISKVNILGLRVFKRWNDFDLVIDCEPFVNLSAFLGWYLGKVQMGFSHGIRSILYNKKLMYNDGQHAVLTYLNFLDILGKKYTIPKRLIKLRYKKEESDKVDKLLNDHNVKEFIGCCISVGHSSKMRMWPKERFAELFDMIIKSYNVKIVLVGTKEDFELNESVINMIKNKHMVNNFAGKTNLKQTFALIERSRLFISNDTGPMHIAAAQKVPTVGLFGPNTPIRFGPYGEKNISVYNPVLEKPCINVHKGEVPECKGHEHMSKISVDDVFSAVEELMKNI